MADPLVRQLETDYLDSRSSPTTVVVDSPSLRIPTLANVRLENNTKRRAARSITCRGLCIALLALAPLCLTMVIILFIRDHRKLSRPHSSDYQHPNSGILSGPTVVKPLVGNPGDLFDIQATVWMRWHSGASLSSNVKTHSDENGASFNQPQSEMVLFSGTVFTAVNLQTRNQLTSVNLQIPMNISKNRVIRETDLRASFVLIPHSPSLLDHAVNYSTINGRDLHIPPVRSYPPLYTPSLQDKIVDSYGITIPLLDLRPYNTWVVDCTNPEPPMHSNNSKRPDDFILEHDDEFPAISDHDDTIGRWSYKRVEEHPYIITRTFLRVVDFKLLYNTKAYDKQHQAMKSRRLMCARNQLDDGWCERRFHDYGNFETKIRLDNGHSKADEADYSWAYAPYMSAADMAYGPMDLVPIPTSHNTCVGQVRWVGFEPMEPSVNVTWRIAYSGRSPAKLIYGDLVSDSGLFQLLHTPNEDGLEDSRQSEYAFYQGVMGHQFRDDFHPRRQLLLQTTSLIFFAVERTLTTYYFWDLSSTVGLSIIGTVLLGTVCLLDYLWEAIASVKDNLSHPYWKFPILLVAQTTALCMIKAALKVEFGWKRGGPLNFIPRVSRARPTHRERASRRIESYVGSWPRIAMTLVICDVALYFLQIDKYYFIEPRLGKYIPFNLFFQRAYVHYKSFQTYVVLPLSTIARILQVMHNRMSRTFAGTYKLVVWISVISILTHIGSESTAIVGNRDIRAGINASVLVQLVLRVLELGQTILYPAVKYVDEECDME